MTTKYEHAFYTQAVRNATREADKRASDAERRAEEAEAALREVGLRHHQTIVPSKLHEGYRFDECPALTCQQARLTASRPSTTEEKGAEHVERP